MNKLAITALLFWLIYNTIFIYAVLFWVKASADAYAWALVPSAIFSILMVAMTVGSQTKDK